MINKEEAKHFYLLTEQLTFTFQMGANSLTNLNTTQIVFIDRTNGITFMKE